ncbi:MAG: hypothetical protein AAGJ50_12940, partial [Pseudomonadota bacterium]
MASFQKHICAYLALMLLAFGLLPFANTYAHAELGAEVSNTAFVTFDQAGAELTIATNEAVFTIEAARTPSTIDFFRFVSGAPDGIITQINGSHFSPSGELTGPFEDIGPPVSLGGMVLDISGDVPLAPADRFIAGEAIFVRVTDAGQNGDPETIETVAVTVSTGEGDTLTLLLFESGPDTGEFFAYFPSTREETPPNNPVLSTPGSANLTAVYVDAFDETEVSIDTALVDPFGRIFDSATGDLLDGVRVTIVDAVTGLPAVVYGADGRSAFPSTILSGSIVTDSSGVQYELEPGEFLFPLLLPGTYQLVIEPPDNFQFPSAFGPEDFETLANAPFEIIDASFGGTFVLDQTGPLNFDVPLDGVGDLVVIKDASTPTTAAGDFVGYTVRIENASNVAVPLRIQDILPRGFRYREGTARVDGEPITDPDIAPDGRTLLFNAGPLRPGESTSLTYLTLATAGVVLGEAVNEAMAVNGAGAPISNRAEAAVFVREDLLRSRLTIVGRVAEDACRPEQEWSRDLADGTGVANVRLYLETGDYVVTDEDGLYHFENVLPG